MAERIKANGYEPTRAMWAYKQDDAYCVFAGGTRLAAVKLLGLKRVPILLHEGFTDQEISRLAEEDNQNDAYHIDVPIVDTWRDYSWLQQQGWSTSAIARTKQVSTSMVRERLKFARLPKSIIQFFIDNDCLKESHASELCKIPMYDHLHPWLSQEQATQFILIKILDRYLKPTARNFAHHIKQLGEVAQFAECYMTRLEPKWQKAFLQQLANNCVMTKAEVEECYATVISKYTHHQQQIEKQEFRSLSKAQRIQRYIEREQRRTAQRNQHLSKLVHGDSREEMQHAPDNIRLLLTDPPYGLEYRNNPTVTRRKPRIANDDHHAPELLLNVLKQAHPKLANDAFVLVWIDWKHYSQFEQVIRTCGLTIRSVVVWNKSNSGRGDCFGTPAPKHEWCIFATKGRPKLNFRFPDVVTGTKFLGSEHPTEKPVDLLELFIKATTKVGDLVVDPFAGVGSTPVTAYGLGREFWACELDAQWLKQGREFLLGAIERKVGIDRE